MEYIYTAMLLHRAGKPVTEEAISATLKAAGLTVDSARVKATVAALSGVNIDEVIKNSQLTAQSAAPAGSTEAKAEKKVEEVDTKAAEEDAAAGLGALFG